MNICGHIIAKEYIIGIGPLMKSTASDAASMMLYNSRQLWFFLHLKNHSIKIESDWFNLGTSKEPTEEDAKAREDYSKFKLHYEQAKYIVVKDLLCL